MLELRVLIDDVCELSVFPWLLIDVVCELSVFVCPLIVVVCELSVLVWEVTVDFKEVISVLSLFTSVLLDTAVAF